VIEQLPALSVQVLLLKLPLLGLTDQVTVPPGVLLVPLSVSLTVAVQVVPVLASTGFGAHETDVLVVRVLTVTVVLPLLDWWVESPP
jgi:hypothetical protein